MMKTVTSIPTVVTLLLLGGSLAPAAAQDAGPAVTQICLAPATVEAATDSAELMSAVHDAFASFLTGPTLGVKPLSARLQSQVRQEARLAGCEYLLLITAKHERKTGGGDVLGKMASGAAQQGAWALGGAAGTSVVDRAVAGAVMGAANSSISDYAMSSQQKDELTLSWRLESATAQVLVEKSEKRKAKADGEDLLTPLAQVASESIAAAAVK